MSGSSCRQSVKQVQSWGVRGMGSGSVDGRRPWRVDHLKVLLTVGGIGIGNGALQENGL